ncbi:uncharacterized protein VTP21DRAFT_2437 [Calcarisporiella thermophila]|uniref:uncharacterized protein n=1 Tax=Calcarisporiella thermophila TaxID=911321 RepID=UPI003742B3C4
MARTLAIDLDECLSLTMAALVKWHNTHYGTQLKESDFFSYNYWEVWGGSRDESIVKVREFYVSEEFREMQPVPGALEAMKTLKERGFKLYVVTSRQEFVRKQTEEFIDRHFPNIFEDIILTNHYLATSEQGLAIPRMKSEICHQLKAELLVDDTLHNAFDVANAGINVLLFDLNASYAWSRLPEGEELPPRVKRVFSWEQVLEQPELSLLMN